MYIYLQKFGHITMLSTHFLYEKTKEKNVEFKGAFLKLFYFDLILFFAMFVQYLVSQQEVRVSSLIL